MLAIFCFTLFFTFNHAAKLKRSNFLIYFFLSLTALALDVIYFSQAAFFLNNFPNPFIVHYWSRFFVQSMKVLLIVSGLVLLFNCSQTKFVAIILVLSVFFYAIFRLTDFSSDNFDFSSSKTG